MLTRLERMINCAADGTGGGAGSNETDQAGMSQEEIDRLSAPAQMTTESREFLEKAQKNKAPTNPETGKSFVQEG